MAQARKTEYFTARSEDVGQRLDKVLRQAYPDWGRSAVGRLIQNRQVRLVIVRAGGLLLNIVLNVILLPRIGPVGAAISGVIAELIVTVILLREWDTDGLHIRRVAPRLVRLLAAGAALAHQRPARPRFLRGRHAPAQASRCGARRRPVGLRGHVAELLRGRRLAAE